MHLSRAVIHEISIGIERRGIEFYKVMKERVDDDFIDFMIEQEQEHIRVFSDIFGTGNGEADAEPLLSDYMDDSYLAAAYADTAVFSLVNPRTVEADKLYDVAILMEKNAMLFYSELINEMPERYQADIDMLKRIRNEEREHLRMLLEKKLSLAG